MSQPLSNSKDKTALLCVSFGTSVPSGMAGISSVEVALSSLLPHARFVRAFTNPTIRSLWERRGESIHSLESALEELITTGISHLVVQPTYFLSGFEYERTTQTLRQFAPHFSSVRLGRPLVTTPQDCQALAHLLATLYPPMPDTVTIWVGHGTAHSANTVYSLLQTLLDEMGRRDILIGTVEGSPLQDEIQKRLSHSSAKTVRLVPLLLVAGEHVLHDLAGSSPKSWKSLLLQEGYEVEVIAEGLGTRPEIQTLYQKKLQALLEEDNGI